MRPSSSRAARSRRSLAVALALLVAVALPATAGTTSATTGIGDFPSFTGSSTDYAGTMQIPATGFPQASITSTSRAGQVGPQSGASMWFGSTTPPGGQFGSSQDQPYINLRPRADNATSPSFTTYTFQRQTPLGWGFVLGDIDADAVTVSATTADGSAATAADLGFQSAFNMCDVSPKPSGCPSGSSTDEPTWDPGDLTLTGNGPDTVGAAGWFVPTVPLRSLTFRFTHLSGFPIYQTWFAVVTHSVSGTVSTSDTCDVDGLPVRLLDPTGAVVGSTVTAAGAFTFSAVPAGPDYSVELGEVPSPCIHDGPTTVEVDVSGGDATADFTVRELIPLPISGFVRDDDGNPLAGVTVTIDNFTDPVRTVVSGSDGYYIFDTNPAGTYSLSVTEPDGYTTTTTPDPVVVQGTPDEVPATDQNFVLTSRPDISGTVSDSGGGVGGITVRLVGGSVLTTVTAADGTYRFPRVPSGPYSVDIPNPGSNYNPVAAQVVEVTDEDEVADFALTRPGAVSGTVVDEDDNPVPGVTVSVAGPGYSVEFVTDNEGNYSTGDLDPGDYVVTVTPPADMKVKGPSSRVATVADSGQNVGGVNFRLKERSSVTDPGDGDGDGDGDEGRVDDISALPGTGGRAAPLLPIGLACLVSGIIMVATSRGTTSLK